MSNQDIDVKKLESELKQNISGEVRFDDGSRALYSTDASNYRQIPIGVVIPKIKDDVIKTVGIASKYNAPILSRGGGTSLAGQCCNVAVVIDFSKYMNKIIEINEEEKYAIVEPGLVLDELRKETEKINLTYGPDPATHSRCTFGGMIGNNSCGIHSVIAGRTVDNVIELEILTYDGLHIKVGETSPEELEEIIEKGDRKAEIYATLKEIRDKHADEIKERYPDIPRRVSGYNLDELLPENNFNVARALVGTESTCIVVLSAKVKLIPWPKKRTLVVLGYKDVYDAGSHVTEILKFNPIGLEGIDNNLTDFMKEKKLHIKDLDFIPDGKGWLLVEFGGESKEDSDAQAKKMIEKLKNSSDTPSWKLYDDAQEESHIWEIRESGLGATAHLPGEPDAWPGWEDAAVSPDSIENYLEEFRNLLNKYDYSASLYGHFGQGCIHTRIPFDLQDEKGIRDYRSFISEASDLVLKYNGSFSGEHGDGQARGELLVKMYGEDLIEAFRKFKKAWDPKWKMNPGKVIDPDPITANLRLGADYDPWNPDTYFKYPADKGDFSHAMLRCVGVGKCRRKEGAVMCPSYMVTHEEKHSTRGRSRLLFEMLQGDVITDGWKSEPVKEALDLCLACKGCKSDCPVDVDMATYKAEFFSHYYKGRLRPKHAYAFGMIYWVAKLGSAMPNLTNWVTHASVLKDVAKYFAGMSKEREIPSFAKQTFRKWYENNYDTGKNREKKKIILWPDTFNNNFHPETIKAALDVLDDAGYRIEIPKRPLCCGRPLYDYGMLDQAKRQLDDIMYHLKDDIENGVPIVGMEPSCIAVFRDELKELFPNNDLAKKLSDQSFMLSEFLYDNADHFKIPQLDKKAVVQHHCHHHSVMDFDKEIKIMKKMGIDVDVLESSCCGMAGAFGFEKEKYQVSVDCADLKLLPAIKDSDKETLIIADGFSCREQVMQLTDRVPLNLSEVILMGMLNPDMNEEEFKEKLIKEIDPKKK